MAGYPETDQNFTQKSAFLRLLKYENPNYTIKFYLIYGNIYLNSDFLSIFALLIIQKYGYRYHTYR